MAEEKPKEPPKPPPVTPKKRKRIVDVSMYSSATIRGQRGKRDGP